MKQLPELERPYEKLELYGEKILSDAELLAIIIKNGTKEETSVQVAQKILGLNHRKEYNLDFLREVSMEQLKKIKGIGRVKAIQLKAVIELSIRMSRPSDYRKIIVKEPRDVANFLMEELRFQTREIAKIVILNNKNEILKIKDIAMGGTNFANLSMKDIMAEPLRMEAPKIILVHNHPSGDPTPSNQDIIFTNQLYEIALTLEIQLVDHLVIGNQHYVSIFSEILSKTKD